MDDEKGFQITDEDQTLIAFKTKGHVFTEGFGDQISYRYMTRIPDPQQAAELTTVLVAMMKNDPRVAAIINDASARFIIDTNSNVHTLKSPLEGQS